MTPVIVSKLHDWYLVRWYSPRKERFFEGYPEWVAQSDLDMDPAVSGDAWWDAVMRRSEIEHRLMPVEPWPERLWARYQQRQQLCGLYAARARRRDDVMRIPRRWIGERPWAVGTWIASDIAGTVAAIWRFAHDHDYEVLSWPEWQEVLTDNDDPPTRCVAFAAGEAEHGCAPYCSSMKNGKVRCLKPRRS